MLCHKLLANFEIHWALDRLDPAQQAPLISDSSTPVLPQFTAELVFLLLPTVSLLQLKVQHNPRPALGPLQFLLAAFCLATTCTTRLIHKLGPLLA